MKHENLLDLGRECICTDSRGSITAIIKPVRNQFTGELQRWHHESYRMPYDHMGKPQNRANKTA